MVDTVALVHAMILRLQALVFPIQALVLSGIDVLDDRHAGTLASACRPHSCQLHCAVHPPSIGTAAPVIDAAALVQRNTASSPICSVVTNWCVGCACKSTFLTTSSSVMPRAFAVSGICFSTSGVST